MINHLVCPDSCELQNIMTEHFCKRHWLIHRFSTSPPQELSWCGLVSRERERGRERERRGSVFIQRWNSPLVLCFMASIQRSTSARQEPTVYFPAVSMETAEQIVGRPRLSPPPIHTLSSLSIQQWSLSYSGPRPHNKGVTTNKL